MNRIIKFLSTLIAILIVTPLAMAVATLLFILVGVANMVFLQFTVVQVTTALIWAVGTFAISNIALYGLTKTDILGYKKAEWMVALLTIIAYFFALAFA